MSIHEIVYGDLTLTDEQIREGELYETRALLSDALEIGTFQAELHIEDPAAGQALAAFRRNQPLCYYFRGMLRGTYYVEQVQRTGKYSYTIKANNALALLEQSEHFGGIYTGETVAQVVGDICNIPYQIQHRFSGVKLYGHLPIATRRANLAQVLFSVGAHAKVDRKGVLRIEALWDGVSAAIPEERIFLGDAVTYAAGVTEVSVLEHQYIPGDETVTLFEGTSMEGDRIRFSQPAHSLTAEGFRILEQGANYAVLSAGSGTLRGKEYVHTTREVRVEVTPGEVSNVVEVTSATLVTLTSADAVAQRLAAYYKCGETVSHTVLHDGEATGDVAAFRHPYDDTDVTGCIKDATVSLGGTLVAEETAVLGYLPPPPAAGMYDRTELLTGSGTWTVPEGVTSVRVVLIGGGAGGASGTDGEDAPKATVESGFDSWGNTYEYASYVQRPDTGGQGGEAGEPGSGGTIYQTTLQVQSGQRISYRCGAGGAGGAADGETAVSGSPGGETTFGALTSAAGARNPDGWLEEDTQTVFAAAGRAGVEGGTGTGYNIAEGAVTPGTPVEYRGEVYQPGADNAQVNEDDYSGTKYLSAQANGGHGGGAAAGHSGEPGGAPGSATASSTRAYAKGGDGGKGADAVKPETRPEYGSGGDGGNGGGGGGVSGYALALARVDWGGSSPTLSAAVGSPGQGGKGSGGGDGTEGCVVLYYSAPAEGDAFGALVEQRDRYLLDKYGRQIVM